MQSTKYVLDRFDDGFGVFLQVGAEENEKLISLQEIPTSIQEGDVLEINESSGKYVFSKFEEDTQMRKDKVFALIQKLRTKE